MDIQTEKIKIVKTILNTNDMSVIQAVNQVLEKVENEEVVGVKPDGTPLTRFDFLKGMAISEQQIKEGKVVDVEDILKEIGE